MCLIDMEKQTHTRTEKRNGRVSKQNSNASKESDIIFLPKSSTHCVTQ